MTVAWPNPVTTCGAVEVTKTSNPDQQLFDRFEENSQIVHTTNMTNVLVIHTAVCVVYEGALDGLSRTGAPRILSVFETTTPPVLFLQYGVDWQSMSDRTLYLSAPRCGHPAKHPSQVDEESAQTISAIVVPGTMEPQTEERDALEVVRVFSRH